MLTFWDSRRGRCDWKMQQQRNVTFNNTILTLVKLQILTSTKSLSIQECNKFYVAIWTLFKRRKMLSEYICNDFWNILCSQKNLAIKSTNQKVLLPSLTSLWDLLKFRPINFNHGNILTRNCWFCDGHWKKEAQQKENKLLIQINTNNFATITIVDLLKAVRLQKHLKPVHHKRLTYVFWNTASLLFESVSGSEQYYKPEGRRFSHGKPSDRLFVHPSWLDNW